MRTGISRTLALFFLLTITCHATIEYSEWGVYRDEAIGVEFRFPPPFIPVKNNSKRSQSIIVRLSGEGDTFLITQQLTPKTLDPKLIQLDTTSLKKDLKAQSLTLKGKATLKGFPTWFFMGERAKNPFELWILLQPTGLLYLFCDYSSPQKEEAPVCHKMIRSLSMIQGAHGTQTDESSPVIGFEPKMLYVNSSSSTLTLEKIPLVPSIERSRSEWEIAFKQFILKMLLEDGINAQQIDIRLSKDTCGEEAIACVKKNPINDRLMLVYNDHYAEQLVDKPEGRSYVVYSLMHEMKHIRFWQPDRNRELTMIRQIFDAYAASEEIRTTFDVQIVDNTLYITPKNQGLTPKQLKQITQYKQKLIPHVVEANTAVDEIEADAYAILQWKHLFKVEIPFEIKWSARVYMKKNIARLNQAIMKLEKQSIYASSLAHERLQHTVDTLLHEIEQSNP